MSIFTELAKTVLGPIGVVIDLLDLSGEKKLEVKSKIMEQQIVLQTEVEKAITVEVQAKQAVLVAELQQGDNYTKRARPTVVYAGLGIAFVNYVVLPWVSHFLGQAPPTINVPVEFWVGWSGIVGTWVIGRSAERRGVQNRLIGMITGGGK